MYINGNAAESVPSEDPLLRILALVKGDLVSSSAQSLFGLDPSLLETRFLSNMPVQAFSMFETLRIAHEEYSQHINAQTLSLSLWSVMHRLDPDTAAHCLRVASLTLHVLEKSKLLEKQGYSSIIVNQLAIFNAVLSHDTLKVLIADVLNGLTKDKAKGNIGLINELKVSHVGPYPYYLGLLGETYNIPELMLLLMALIGTLHHEPIYPHIEEIVFDRRKGFTFTEEHIRTVMPYLNPSISISQEVGSPMIVSISSYRESIQATLAALIADVIDIVRVCDVYDALTSQRVYRDLDPNTPWKERMKRGLDVIAGLPEEYQQYVKIIADFANEHRSANKYGRQLLSIGRVYMNALFRFVPKKVFTGENSSIFTLMANYLTEDQFRKKGFRVIDNVISKSFKV